MYKVVNPRIIERTTFLHGEDNGNPMVVVIDDKLVTVVRPEHTCVGESWILHPGYLSLLPYSHGMKADVIKGKPRQTVRAEGRVGQGDMCDVVGSFNVVLGDLCRVEGDHNWVVGNLSTVKGSGHVVHWDLHGVEGGLNTVEGDICRAEGIENVVEGDLCRSLVPKTLEGMGGLNEGMRGAPVVIAIPVDEENEVGEELEVRYYPTEAVRESSMYGDVNEIINAKKLEEMGRVVEEREGKGAENRL